MNIVLGSDHAGYDLRQVVANHLIALGHNVTHVGADSAERYDYPLAADSVARTIIDDEAECGILICGTGIGVSIRANRYLQIRAALCTTIEMAQLAKEHNQANVLCIGARILQQEQALAIVDAFITTEPDTSERHQHRVDLLGKEAF